MRYTQLTPLGIVGLIGVGIFLGALAATGNPHIAWPLVPLAYLVWADGKGEMKGVWYRTKGAFWFVPYGRPAQFQSHVEDVTHNGNSDGPE